jgi:hypothetical protein
MQRELQNFSKILPKLHLYYNTLPKKANPKDSKIPTIEQPKPKAMQNELHQNDAYLEHQDLHE